jgi:hypothetical protein
MVNIEISLKEANFLVALLEADRQTALQLLAADHFYQPFLLPKLHKAQKMLKKVQELEQSFTENEQQVD